jgi:hypothetical protein
MKRSTQDIIKSLLFNARCKQTDEYDAALMHAAANRLEQFTMPDDATFARIVNAMNGELYAVEGGHPDRLVRNAYRAAIRAVES